MEITHNRLSGQTWRRRCWCTILLMVCLQVHLFAQTPGRKYMVRDGRMLIELNKQLPAASIDSFLVQFNLTDLGLKHFLQTGKPDSLQQQGWHIEHNSDQLVVITKPLMVFENLINPADRIIFTEKDHAAADLFPEGHQRVVLGFNRFKNKKPFPEKDSVVTFYLRNNPSARKVYLAGTFNGWSPTSLKMNRVDSGWIAQVPLAAGKHWYKFVIDDHWEPDFDNQLRENDGRGNINSVYYKTNVVFRLNAFPNAKRVYLAGSFNNWRERHLQLTKTANGWELPLFLAPGTHVYKFIVDGDWHHDPANPETVPDGHNGVNSLLRLGPTHLFRLEGYTGAREVFLAGSFNQWRDFELPMKKTPTGWELPYAIGPGNYEYKFKVDGKWVLDPANPLKVGNPEGTGNSYLILSPNHTFRLRNHGKAKAVYVAGDFNNWDPKALRMKKEGDDWVFSLHLPVGKNRYKFIVDGEWIIDPDNKLWEQNEHHTGNSIIWIER
ncbi:glycogen-binding domain-containing protein [Rufibacter psychrotolerans]|uniref:glycogen-binding domain-containing protein n=1 Tax=Rufibacter psychrotolerans TaxID=2812556 RepID=UPI001967BDE6|nr:glycogen-binding domain-containing protein [Rufibacter sp. SYSU D00308]